LPQAFAGAVARLYLSRDVSGPALRKHTLVTNVMQNEGYSILMDGVDDWKRTFWLMGREGFDLDYLSQGAR